MTCARSGAPPAGWVNGSLVAASSFGILAWYDDPVALTDEPVRQDPGRFATEVMTLDDLDAALLERRGAVDRGACGRRGLAGVAQHSIEGRPGRGRADPRAQAGRGVLRDGTVVAAVCPGMIATDASRPWFDDMSAAQSPLEAAVPVLRLALDPVDPGLHGELVQFGRVFPW
jgi:carbonyl reductase 1